MKVLYSLSRAAGRASFRLGARLFFAAALCTAAGAGHAQAPDCTQLLGQINAIDRANAQSNPYAAAVQKQRAEVERSINYARSIGCDRQQFLFFGKPPPPQCPRLNAQIQKMRANLQQLEAEAARNNNSPERQQLAARYNSSCRQRPRGFFESLFGGGNPAGPVEGGAPGELPPNPDEQKPTGGSEALCVRTCDGGFFPLVYSARRSPQSLTELCKASCPNTEARVYTRVPGQVVNTAVGLDGAPYMNLPNALKFEKAVVPDCTCKPAGESWAQALANAESVLGNERKGDIIVTPEKSAEMSRPKLSPAQRAKVFPATAKGSKSSDDAEAHDAASAAEVPTASNDSAGIATGDVKPAASFPQGEGQTVEVTGPDGKKHRVRIVGPRY
ncbi:MAG: DUF2865 domain-containing protein [Methylovirgula sp.]